MMSLIYYSEVRWLFYNNQFLSSINFPSEWSWLDASNYFHNSSLHGCLLSTYTNLSHLLSLNQSLSCFLQLVFSISSSVDPVYVFHPLYVPLLSSIHLPQVISKHDHTISHLFTLASLSAASFSPKHLYQLHCIPLFHQLYLNFYFTLLTKNHNLLKI